MNTFLKIILDNVHFSDYALHTYQLISQFARQSAWGHKVGTQISVKTNIVMLYLALKPRFLLAQKVSFKKVFGKAVINSRVLNQISSSLLVMAPQTINVDFQ